MGNVKTGILLFLLLSSVFSRLPPDIKYKLPSPTADLTSLQKTAACKPRPN